MTGQAIREGGWKFGDIIAIPAIRERWEKVRRYFFLRESTYDMTNRCNIRCDGCYYFNGEKQFAAENGDESAWRQLMAGGEGAGHHLCGPGRRRAVAGARSSAGSAPRPSRLGPSPPTASRRSPGNRLPDSHLGLGQRCHQQGDQEGRRHAGPPDGQLPGRPPGGLCLHLHPGQHRTRPRK